MKINFLTNLMFSSLLFLCSQALKAQEYTSVDTTIYLVVDEQPKYFGGGIELLAGFIANNIKIHPICMDLEGTVYAEFVVEKNGEVTHEKIIKGIVNDYDKEALRVLKLIPTCTPGKKNGVVVRTKIIVPIRFKLR